MYEITYEITYEISGDESGSVIETAELSEQTSLNYSQTMLSTASSGSKVSVKITDNLVGDVTGRYEPREPFAFVFAGA